MRPAISRAFRATLLVLSAAAAGCSGGTGVVELNWAFVDREGSPVYPGGQFALNRYESSCGLPGVLDGAAIKYDLQVELQICDPACAGGCDDPACRVVEPARFPCKTARASEEIPSASEPYLFQIRAVIVRDGQACDDLPPQCVAVPGPRERTVGDGKLTDLQVYQIGIEMDGDAAPSSGAAQLDLEACGCGNSP